ncbi:MAG: ATP-binding cassette domain-containing protein, partial [Dehalococcoidia bacterium]|nr:ATP-binding cassette domain-containing protein [Dehalococcoidia bacterium]
TFSRSISAGERIFEVLDAVSPVEERQGVTDLGRAKGRVRFEGVSFSYARSTPPQAPASPGADRGVDHSPPSLGDGGLNRAALRDIDLEVSPGQKIAILGTPGSGKSTLVSLIPRFYEVTQGRITIDGVDVRDVTLESLRRNVGMVLQDVFLFIASVRENISYGVANASLEQVTAAARSVNLHDFIMDLPEGYNTLVGERGVTLSGGQKQRKAIARTLLQDPSILILDDSTSSVDARTESLIQAALDEVMKGRTTFIIANRVSSLKKADLILVMKDGDVVERGTHQELITRDGLYSEIYRLQLFAEEDVLMEASPEDN